MQGSIVVSSNPVAYMDNAIFRQRLFGLRERVPRPSMLNTSNVLGGGGGGEGRAIAKCLFGSPDPQQVTDLVKEVELKNALNFGKRFNFDVVNGSPFPDSKRRKLNDSTFSSSTITNDSDEENVSNGGDEDGYIWTEIVTSDPSTKSISPSATSPNQPNSQQSSMLPPNPPSITDEQPNMPKEKKSHSQSIPASFSNKKTSRSHGIITKYTKRVLKQAATKKPTTSVITDFLKMQRVKNCARGVKPKTT